MPRTASSSSQLGGTSVSETVPRQSTWRPAASPRTRVTCARTPPRSAGGETGSNSSESVCASSARQPLSVGSIAGPSGSATGFLPSNRIVAPERAVPWMSWAASKKDSASAGALTARVSGAGSSYSRAVPSTS